MSIHLDTPNVAATHLTVSPAGAPHQVDELTLVWSTRPEQCRPGDDEHQTIHHHEDTPPPVYDLGSGASGGGWDVRPEQCEKCGQYSTITAILEEGHLIGEDLEAVAAEVAQAAQAVFDGQAEQVRRRLRAMLRSARGDESTSDDAPGFCDEDGELAAWDYYPGGDDTDIILITQADL